MRVEATLGDGKLRLAVTLKPGRITSQTKYNRSINVGDLIFTKQSQLRSTMQELKVQGQWAAECIIVEKQLNDKIKQLTDDLKNCKCK